MLEEKMPRIVDCNAVMCAYNINKRCHTPGINVGNGGCPLCDTAIKRENKAGYPDISGRVGSCKEVNCTFNVGLECQASNGIHVILHSEHPECGTFEPRKSQS
ncbi:MAG: DUF1540 domain-containing protein [Candidatus Omnitrophota bacterium]